MKLLFLLLCCQVVAQPKDVLSQLMKGNQRAMDGKLEHPAYFNESRMNTVEKQEPIAVIVACSDSRVSPETLFDQGIGKLFVVRVAGNVVGPIEMESIHYAVTQLKVPLILVMGHENCGAVEAVLEKKDGTIPEIAALIRPSIQDGLQASIESNVRHVVEGLQRTDFIQELVKKGQLEVVGACYHLQTGAVQPL